MATKNELKPFGISAESVVANLCCCIANAIVDDVQKGKMNYFWKSDVNLFSR